MQQGARAAPVHIPVQYTNCNLINFRELAIPTAGVMAVGNTLLSGEELEMLVILRMNRDFMDFMRTNHAAEASKYMKQQFGCTVVEADG